MVTSIKTWLAPPVFAGDETKTHRANLLNMIIVCGLCIILLTFFANFFDPQTPVRNFLIDLLIIAALLYLRRHLHQGRVALVALLILPIGFVGIIISIISDGTIRTPGTSLLLLWVVIASILFELRGFVLSTIAASLAVMGLILAQQAGIMPPPVSTVSAMQWLVLTITTATTGGLTYLAYQTTQRALARAEREIAERQRVEVDLRKLTRAVEQSSALIVITTLDGTIEYVNHQFTQVTGYGFDESVGKTPRMLKTDRTPLETHRQLWVAITAGKHWHGEFVNRKKDGSLYYESAIISPITDQHGVPTHYLAVKEDITERKRAEAAIQRANEELRFKVAEIEQLHAVLREQSLRDPLTGLYNRRYLTETLTREVARAERDHGHLSVIISDIDHFKKINDTYGHQVGDRILIEIASLIRTYVRSSDIICRYGGEEFLLVMPGSPVDAAARRAEEIRHMCAAFALCHDGQELKITMSFGVATYPTHGHGAEDVIIKADKALYQSKHRGRDRVTIWAA